MSPSHKQSDFNQKSVMSHHPVEFHWKFSLLPQWNQNERTESISFVSLTSLVLCSYVLAQQLPAESGAPVLPAVSQLFVSDPSPPSSTSWRGPDQKRRSTTVRHEEAMNEKRKHTTSSADDFFSNGNSSKFSSTKQRHNDHFEKS